MQNDLFPSKFYENLLLLILHIIETETWAFHETWGEVFVELAKRYPVRCLSEAFTLTAFSQVDSNRLIGGYVLAAVVCARNGDNCEDLIKKIFAMAQDPASIVRKTMCKALKLLTKVLSKKKIESQVVPEVLKLVEDDSDEVLESALPLFCEFMDFCSYQYKEEIVDILKSSFFTLQVNKLGPVKLKFFGRVLVSLRLCIDEEFRNLCVNWFEGFQQSKEEDVQMLMAHNFPALLYIVGSMTENLWSSWKYLESIQSPSIRRALAERLGDVCQFSMCKESEMFKTVKTFAEDQKTFGLVLGQFFVIAKSLKNFEYFVEVLISKLALVSSDWRTQVLIIDQLTQFVSNFDCLRYLEHLFNFLFELVSVGCNPVRSSSCRLLSEIFYKNLPKHEEYSVKLVNILCKSASYQLRIVFIKFCSHLSLIASHKYFHKNFYQHLVLLAKDPVKEVAYEFANEFCRFRLALPFGDFDSPSEYRKLVNFYLETGDPHLAEFAFGIDGKVDKLVSEHYTSVNEAKENLKVKMESEAMVREVVEAKPVVRARPRKSTLVPRGSSQNPVKRFSLVEIDKAELSRVIQRSSANKKKGVK